MRILLVLVYFSVFSIDVFADSCKGVFKTQAKQEQKEVQNILETDSKFSDKKYSLKFLKTMIKYGSVQQVKSLYPRLEEGEELQIVKFYMKNKDERSYLILYFSNFQLIFRIAYNLSNDRHSRSHYDDYFQEGLKQLPIIIQQYYERKEKGMLIPLSGYIGKSTKNNIIRYRKRIGHLGAIRHVLPKNYTDAETGEILLSRNQTTRIEDVLLNRIYLRQIKDWTMNHLKTMRMREDVKKNRDLYLEVVEKRIFADESVDLIEQEEMAKKWGLSRTRISHIEKQIREMIKDEFHSSQLNRYPKEKKNVVLNKELNRRSHIEPIEEWTMNHLKTMKLRKHVEKHRDLYIYIAKNRIFVEGGGSNLFMTQEEIAKRWGSKKAEIGYIERKIRKIIKDEFHSSQLNKSVGEETK